MTINEISEKYYTKLDDSDKIMIDNRVAEIGVEEYLNQQLIYLDCSRVLQGMRMMQTIGYPYKREISSFMYVMLNKVEFASDTMETYSRKLIERHIANIEYEKENPPIWYDGKPKKGSKRKSKAKEGDMFPEETKKSKISKAEAKLAAKLIGANINFGGFKLKKD